MNTTVIQNFAKLRFSLLLLPLFLLIAIVVLLYSQDSLNVEGYVQIQKNCFFYLNHYLGQYPIFEQNLTQIGDASIVLSFLIIFIIYAPKMWEALISASLVSLVFSKVLKPYLMFQDLQRFMIMKLLSSLEKRQWVIQVCHLVIL